jgi:glutaredoxin 3
MSGQKSVPNVFVKGKHMGGNDDTQAAAKEGKLQEMLGI